MENKKIVVFGSYVTDLTGRTPKFPTEGETVMGVSFKSGPGGKRESIPQKSLLIKILTQVLH